MTHRVGLYTQAEDVHDRLLAELTDGLDDVEITTVPDPAPSWDGFDCVVAWVDNGASHEQLHQLAVRADATRLFLIVDRDDSAEAVRAVHCGAHDFIARPYRKHELVAALALALDPSAEAEDDETTIETLRERFAELSAREREVVDLMMQGNCNDSIAEQLDLAPKTIAIHIANVSQKMGAPTLARLARQISAVQHSLV